MVGFWGDIFRNYFADFCLPSLLSPNNLGLLSAADGHRFLICTTPHDWAKLTKSPLWSVLAEHATPRFIEIGLPKGPSSEAKFKHMTLCQRLTVNAAMKDRALACHIFPDAMYLDGTIATALRYASEGLHAVLTVPMRLKQESLFAGLNQRGLLPNRADETAAQQPLTVKSRSVVDLAIANLYDDFNSNDWDNPNFPRWPSSCFWRLPDQSGILIHSAYYNYILLDMARIERHNERSFDIARSKTTGLAITFRIPRRSMSLGIPTKRWTSPGRSPRHILRRHQCH